MKFCPTCKETYDDQTNFCLADGTTLLKKKSPKGGSRHSHWNDVVAVILVAVAILIMLCLMTSSPEDRSIVSTGGISPGTKNWIGVVGANIAAVLLNAFGWTSYLLPILVVIIAWRIFQSDTLIPRASRVAGYIVFAISLSAIITLLGGYGAIVGKAAATGTAYLIGSVGTGILYSALFFCSILLITNFTLAGFLGHFDIAGDSVKGWVGSWWERYRERRHERVEEAQKRAEKRKGRRKEKPFEADAALEDLPPTIAVGAPVLEPEPIPIRVDDEPSIPTIDTKEDPYETRKVFENGTFQPEFPEMPLELVAEVPPADDEDDDLAQEPAESFEAAGSGQDYANYVLPSPDLLTEAPAALRHQESELREVGRLLERKTAEFNVPGKVMNISPGPVVTTFEFKPDAGVKYSRVTGLVDDLCLALKAPSIRIDRIPGKAYVGIEVPNHRRETIYLREVIESPKFAKESQSLLTLALGKSIDGTKYVADLAKMPHLLIAGATGAGKSVGVNTLVMSILYKAKPDEVKFIMVDPKRLELGLYADIPHLSTPIITDPKRAATALRWAVTEMERRYKDLAGYAVRNIGGYNEKIEGYIREGRLNDVGDPFRKLPYIVIIIDELADLMMVSGKEVEESITRLAQMARAVGIHLVLATQRPSVDVITGLIKANFPSRISFRVSSKVDSRTIIDGNGAESLLGQGDMLFLPPGNSNVVRVHGAFVDETEITKVVDFIKAQGRPEYDTTITKTEDELDESSDLPGRRDPLFMEALKCVVHAKRGSTSLLQRHLRIGYGRAAAILDAMVREGYIGDMDGSSRARPVLQKAYDDLQDVVEGALGDTRQDVPW
jgi:S-DNA-T family DNA segregation ATPase FtsK/SpoIIIE